MLLYNKTLVNQVPADTDAWVRQLKTLTDPANGQYGLVFDTTESYWLIPWLSGFGGWPLDAQEKPALDTAEMVEALWFLHDLKFQDKVMPEKADYQAAFDLFSQGKAAYIVDGMWNLDRYSGLGVDLGVRRAAPGDQDQAIAGADGDGAVLVCRKGGERRQAGRGRRSSSSS